MSADKESRDNSFYAQPEDIIASLGNHVVLTCAAEGSPAPEIAWLKDDEKIATRDAVLFQGKGSSTSALTIQSVEKKDSGRYACQATSHVTSTISWEAVLAIADTSARNESNDAKDWCGKQCILNNHDIFAAAFFLPLIFSVFIKNKE